MEEIKKVNQDPIFIDWISEEEDRRKLYNTMINRAKNEGKEETQEEMIKNMLESNLTKEQIHEYTKVPLEEIEKIISSK